MDKIEELVQLREDLVDDIELRHNNRLNIALRNIEDEIAALSRSLPLKDGKLFEARRAIAIRTELKNIIDKHYLPWADSTVREYDKVAKQIVENMKVLPVSAKFKTLTQVDVETITNLKRVKFTGFANIASETTNALADNVYSSTISGKSFNEMQKELRQRINGIYINADVDEIDELVEFIATSTDQVAIEKAATRLRTFYGADRTGENMRKYSKQLAHDSLMEFDGQFTKAKAEEAGLTHYIYYGDLIGDSRQFCKNRVRANEIFSEVELREQWAREPWKGKSGSDPFVNRGGYNCRHHFQPTDPSWYDADGNLILDEEIGTSTKVKTETDVVKQNKSSVAKTKKFNDITNVSNAVAQSTLATRILENAKDKRYPKFENGKPRSRFSQSEKIGSVNLKNLTDSKSTQVLVIMDELDELAKKYDIPKLRGIYTYKRRRGAAASMGDGTLMLNPTHINRIEKNNKPSKWKYGDDVKDRPFVAGLYFEDEVDRLRNLMYHEFAHHIHQMKYVDEFTELNRRYKPKVEKQIIPLFRKKRGATKYSDANAKEWFAENFSLYEMGKKDLVDERFIKLIEELQ